MVCDSATFVSLRSGVRTWMSRPQPAQSSGDDGGWSFDDSGLSGLPTGSVFRCKTGVLPSLSTLWLLLLLWMLLLLFLMLFGGVIASFFTHWLKYSGKLWLLSSKLSFRLRPVLSRSKLNAENEIYGRCSRDRQQLMDLLLAGIIDCVQICHEVFVATQ